MDIEWNPEERDFIQDRIRAGRAASEDEIVRHGLQLLMERDEKLRQYDAWREETRQKIDIGHQQALDGDTVDGEEFLEQLRLEIEEHEVENS